MSATPSSLEAYRYRLSLHEPIALPHQALLPDRIGLLVRLRTDDGREGWGDVAPLSPISPDTLEDGVRGLGAISSRLDRLDSALAGPELQAAPALVCGLEQAREALLRRDAKEVGRVAVNALLTGTAPEVLRRAAALREEGYRCFKLKVGAGSIDADIARARAAREGIGLDAELRLDANRAWTTSDALRFTSAVAELQIEYIEEPLRDPRGMPELHERTGVQFALDESLRDTPAECWFHWSCLNALVIKPMVLGGPKAARTWIQWARAGRMKAVVSSVYESGVGLFGLADLVAAESSDQPLPPAGFDTYSRLSSDVLKTRLRVSGGALELPPHPPGMNDLRMDALERMV